MEATSQSTPHVVPQRVSLGTLFLKFAVIGAVSFGGGVVAYLQRMLVDDTKWLTPEQFIMELEISQTMPGLNAVNMAVLVGDRLRGPVGAFVAASGMILPGAIIVFFIGFAANEFHKGSAFGHAALEGVAAGATGLLAAIVLRTGKKQFLNPIDAVLLAVTFALMSLVKLPLWVILVVLAPIAIFIYRPRPKKPEEHG
ncbi:MAG: chromate transporter [Candidatus Eremiobacteraeota bacterium]|nr:chromate transporter [Candidatus Eremiobacteraeota bacterium]